MSELQRVMREGEVTLSVGGVSSEHEGLAFLDLGSLAAAEGALSELDVGALRLYEGWGGAVPGAGEAGEAAEAARGGEAAQALLWTSARELSVEGWLWVSGRGVLLRPAGGARPGLRYTLAWWVGDEPTPRWSASWETPYGLRERHPLDWGLGEGARDEAERAGREVLARACSCHGEGRAPALDPQESAGAQSQRDPELWVFGPGAPARSALLLRALEGEPTRGERMPPEPAPPLSRADLTRLERWILSR
jgi:hypothetical protein